MRQTERSDQLRERGLTPTIQRLAVLQSLENTRQHPTADQVLVAVRRKFPSVSRATVYNTLEALTKAGIIQQITVDPAVARYDADVGPHAHFRCRTCSTVYDIPLNEEVNLAKHIEGHHVEAVRTYAYGVCAMCSREPELDTGAKQKKRSKPSSSSDSSANTAQGKRQVFSDEPPSAKRIRQQKRSSTASASYSPTRNKHQRKPQASLYEPTKNVGEKSSKTASPSDSPPNTAPRKTQAFSNEPTKEVRDAPRTP